jgi:hypothetical protein
MLETDKVFAGSIPENYDRYMVPLIFEQYAADIAQRAASLSPSAVLETAAGSGVVTRALAPRLSPGASYIVTDLNQPMVDYAASRQPHDPPRFLARTPHGYHDTALIRSELEDVGFSRVVIETRAEQSRASSPRLPAVAYCQGTLLRNEIEARDAGKLEAATDYAESAIATDMATARLLPKFRHT